MPTSAHIGLEQARSELPRLVSQAQAGTCAALVPLQRLLTTTRRGGLLRLRGTGAGLWGPDVARAVSELRNEWD
jgi:hypothetical protein